MKGNRGFKLQRYWSLKEEVLDRIFRRTRFGRVMDLSQDRLRHERILYPAILTASLNELQLYK
jgi:hypothetical protein